MEIGLAEHIQVLMNELQELESMRHGIYKAMLPDDVVKQRVKEYDQRIEAIKKEIDKL
ncbi:MAG: hypothetical protein HFJ95_01475 [Muribaculaceae bacterium]|nr:hypothetical protein [Muribaculaceae bacterium]